MTNLFDQIGVQMKKKVVMNIDLMYLSHYVQSCEMCVRECARVCVCVRVCLCVCVNKLNARAESTQRTRNYTIPLSTR